MLQQWVKMSELLKCLRTFVACAWYSKIAPCTHNCLVVKCFKRPTPIPFAALLSMHISKKGSRENSRKSSNAPMPSARPSTIAFNSASPHERALLQWLITCKPCKTMPPLVDFRERSSPAQSPSTSTLMLPITL